MNKNLNCILYLMSFSLGAMDSHDNNMCPPSTAMPAPYSFYIQQAFNVRDQNEYLVSVALLRNPHVSQEAHFDAVKTLQELDLRGFCPAQHYLYYLYLQGMHGIAPNRALAFYYLQRAIDAVYPPALITLAENAIYDASRIHWAPLYDSHGRITRYHPCQYVTAHFYYQQMCRYYQEVQQWHEEQNKTLIRHYSELAQQTNTNLATSESIPDNQTNVQDDNNANEHQQALLSEQENNQQQESLPVQEPETSTIPEQHEYEVLVPINSWHTLCRQCKHDGAALVNILLEYYKARKKEDVLVVGQRLMESNILTVLRQKSSYDYVAYVYGTIFYDVLRNASEHVIQVLQKSLLVHNRDELYRKTYDYLLNARQTKIPQVFIMLADLASSAREACAFLYHALLYINTSDIHTYPDQTPEMLQQTIIKKLHVYVANHEVEALGYLLLSSLSDNSVLDLAYIINLVKQLSMNLSRIGGSFMAPYKLFDRLIAMAEPSDSLECKYEVGKLLYELTRNKKTRQYYFTTALSLLAASRQYNAQAFRAALMAHAASPQKKDRDTAFGWFAQAYQQKVSDEVAVTLKDFFELCKQKAVADPMMAFFVAERLAEGIKDVVGPDKEQAREYYQHACKSGSWDIVVKMVQKIAANTGQAHDTNREFLEYCFHALASFLATISLDANVMLPAHFKKEFAKIVGQHVTTEDTLPLAYKIIKLLLPYDLNYATMLFNHIEKNISQKEVSESLGALLYEDELFGQLEYYCQKNAALALVLQEAIFWRIVRGIWMKGSEEAFNKMHRLIATARQQDPQCADYTTLSATVSLQEGVYWLKQHNTQKACMCLKKAKKYSVVAQALYGDLLLKDTTSAPLGKNYKCGVQEIEAALVSCTPEDFKAIMPTVYFLAQFYLEPPVMHYENLKFLNTERALVLLQRLVDCGDCAAQVFLDEYNKQHKASLASALVRAKELFEQKRYEQALEELKDTQDEDALAYRGFCQCELKRLNEGIATLLNYLEVSFSHEHKNGALVNTANHYILAEIRNLKPFEPDVHNKILYYFIKFAFCTPSCDKKYALERVVNMLEYCAGCIIANVIDKEFDPELRDVTVLLGNNIIQDMYTLAQECSSQEHIFRIIQVLYHIYIEQHLQFVGKHSAHRIAANDTLLEQAVMLIENFSKSGTVLADKERQVIAELYFLYGQLHETRKDTTKALENYAKTLAYNDKHRRALYKRGSILIENEEDEESRTKAFIDLEKAALYGHKRSQALLGSLLLAHGTSGVCLSNNRKLGLVEAIAWLEKATEGNNPDPEALAILGHVYLYGEYGVQPSIKRAYPLLKRAYVEFKQGDALHYGVAALQYSDIQAAIANNPHMQAAVTKTTKKKQAQAVNYLNEAITAFKASQDRFAALFLAKVYLKIGGLITIKAGLDQYITFLENVEMSRKVLHELDQLKVRPMIVNVKIAPYEPLKNYALALEAYKLARWSAANEEEGPFTVALPKVQDYLKRLVNAIDAQDAEHLSLFNGLYAAYYFLSLFSTSEQLTIEQRIRFGFNYLKRALEKGIDKDKNIIKYIDLVFRLKEIKQLIQAQDQETRKLIQQCYQDIVVAPFKKKNIDIGRVFSLFEDTHQ